MLRRMLPRLATVAEKSSPACAFFGAAPGDARLIAVKWSNGIAMSGKEEEERMILPPATDLVFPDRLWPFSIIKVSSPGLEGPATRGASILPFHSAILMLLKSVWDPS